MINLQKFNKKRVAVMGMARSGIASIRSLIAGGAEVFAWDDNPATVAAVQARLKTEGLDCKIQSIAEILKNTDHKLDMIVMSPGIPLYYPVENPIYSAAIAQEISICSDIELLYKQYPEASLIGITGTNGKSTTTALLGHILKSAGKKTEVGGNIGIAALELEPLKAKDDFYILELSSYQLDLAIDLKCDIAICLTITPDHLDRHGSFARYVQAKKRIFNNQKDGDIAIVSADCHTNNSIITELKNQNQKVLQISTETILEDGVTVKSGVLYDNYKSKKTFDVSNIKSLIGEHNAENIAAAFAASVAAGIAPDEIIQYIKTFKALPHRMDFFHQSGNLSFINDSKATNSDSTYWAINSFDNIYWIAGGISKDAGIKILEPLFDKIAHVYLIGQAAESFAVVLSANGVPFTIATTLVNAISLIKSNNISDGNILLSPACSSFDQWKSYEERGDAFIKLVKENWPEEKY